MSTVRVVGDKAGDKVQVYHVSFIQVIGGCGHFI